MPDPADEFASVRLMDDKERSSEPRLLQLRSDRRLGHEWDDWNGLALPGDGDFDTGPRLYFGVLTAATLLTGLCAMSAVWMVTPRLATFHAVLPSALQGAVMVGVLAALVWLALLGGSLIAGKPLLPARLAERGPLPASMRLAERLGKFAGLSRDAVGNSALTVFDGIAMQRVTAHAPESVLLLLPRCLGRDSMRAAIEISARHGVHAFVASRGRYARQMIAKRRPSAVVAVACERDLVSGIADVGRRLPVLGSTLRMPAGPCRDTEIDVAALEGRLLAVLRGREGKGPQPRVTAVKSGGDQVGG